MAGNRVEELEAKVRELEATVDGLTDELLETKERLHALEDEVGVEHDVLEGRLTRTESRPLPTGQRQAQTDEETAGGEAAGGETAAGTAADGGEPSADEVNTDEADGEDNADSESGDDIIVA